MVVVAATQVAAEPVHTRPGDPREQRRQDRKEGEEGEEGGGEPRRPDGRGVLCVAGTDDLSSSKHVHEGGEDERGQASLSVLSGSPSLSVLVVEDNVVNQRVAVSLLHKWGHRATVAGNGAQAVELTRDRRFDLVLMDVSGADMTQGFAPFSARRVNDCVVLVEDACFSSVALSNSDTVITHRCCSG